MARPTCSCGLPRGVAGSSGATRRPPYSTTSHVPYASPSSSQPWSSPQVWRSRGGRDAAKGRSAVGDVAAWRPKELDLEHSSSTPSNRSSRRRTRPATDKGGGEQRASERMHDILCARGARRGAFTEWSTPIRGRRSSTSACRCSRRPTPSWRGRPPHAMRSVHVMCLQRRS